MKNTNNTCQNPECNNKTELHNKKWKGYRAACSPECLGIVKQVKMKATLKDKYGVENSMHLDSTKCKLRETNLEKYGVENPAQSDIVKQKIKNTFDEKYDGHPMYDDSVKDKIKKTNLVKYGVENPSQADEIKDKKQKSSLNKYGVEHPFQSDEIKNKIKKTNLEKYGMENYSQTDEYKTKRKQTMDEKYNGMGNNRNLHPNLNDKDWLEQECKYRLVSSIADEIGVCVTTVYNRLIEYDITPNNLYKSKYEEEIEQILNNMNITYSSKNRKLLSGKELDFYLPDYNLAIEFNGTYWHSEVKGNKNKNYHIGKTRLCNEKGIQLLHIWEHEWNKDKDKILSKLYTLLGNNDRIYARKCEVKSIEYTESSCFLNNNHFQLSTKSKYNYGLYHDNDLVAVMTFSKSRYNKKYEYELVRYCSKKYTNVIGGASKLLTYFIRTHSPTSIISYSDNSRNSGNMYKMLGFEFSSSSQPSYYYTKNYVDFENRIAFQKHKLSEKLDNFDPTITEWQNMKNNGYDRIWDCGTDVWVLTAT